MITAKPLSYEEAWHFLDRLQFFKIKLGLDSMQSFMESLDNPHLQFPVVHIGGTNGKGSVGATLLSILATEGYRVGFYTSPHLSSVRERFRINNSYISRDDFARQAEKIIHILNGRQITYFEFTTVLAMLWFAEQRVDLAILEVGLGGRLDATNIVIPLVSLITNVSMDHEQHLGNTIEEVAYEKAGIIKEEVPVVTGTSGKAALRVIEDKAVEKKSPLYVLGRHFDGLPAGVNKSAWNYTAPDIPGRDLIPPRMTLPLAMKGDYQVGNAAMAAAALDVIAERFPVSPENLRQGLLRVRWPGRLEEFWLNRGTQAVVREMPETADGLYHFLLDGAHNPEGAKALRRSLDSDFIYGHLILVWASMADKDIGSTLLQIAPLADRIIFTRPDEERSAAPESLRKLLPQGLRAKAHCLASVPLALERAMEGCERNALICVAGSLYLVGRARQILLGELVDGS